VLGRRCELYSGARLWVEGRPHETQTLALANDLLPPHSSPAFASAQRVDQILADHSCHTDSSDARELGMESVPDPRCRTARQAENKRFLAGYDYTDSPVPRISPMHWSRSKAKPA